MLLSRILLAWNWKDDFEEITSPDDLLEEVFIEQASNFSASVFYYLSIQEPKKAQVWHFLHAP